MNARLILQMAVCREAAR